MITGKRKKSIYYLDTMMRDKITFDTTVGAYCLIEWDEDGNPRNVKECMQC